MSEPIYETNFENAEKVNAHNLNIDLPHVFSFAGTLADGQWHSGEDGARFWVEDGTNVNPHSGSRCIGMELFDITKARRCSFNLIDLEGLGLDDEYGISMSMFIPPDWMLHAPDPSWQRWYNICAILSSDKNPLGHYAPTLECRIGQPTLNVPEFSFALSHRNYNNAQSTPAKIESFPLPRGRWFNIRWWLLRHLTEGAVKVWVDGNLVFDVAGIETRWDGYAVTMAKIYHDLNDDTSHELYVDSLKIYTKEPPAPTPKFPLNLPVAIATGGLALAATGNPFASATFALIGGLLTKKK